MSHFIHSVFRGLLAAVAVALLACVPLWGSEQEAPPRYLQPEALAAERALQALRYGATPDEAYGAFNEFVRQVFGAECEPLLYEKFGHDLLLKPEGFWRYASDRSAVIGWESNLPAVSYVEYGSSAELGQRTATTDRHYFLHIHHLSGLEAGRTYHYRLVAVDERGKTLHGPLETFETQAEGSLIPIGEDHQDGPITIGAPGHYVLRQDIISTTSGINVEAEGVTLDLGGHTIIYATRAREEGEFADKWRAYERDGSIGVRNMGNNTFTLLNGTIIQGPTDAWANTGNGDTSGFNPVFIRNASDVHIAGIVVDYHSRQNTGIMNRAAGDNQLFHHNVIRDRGVIVRNRHGSGCRAIHFHSSEGNHHTVRHNLVARARQFGLGLATKGGQLIHNEVYVDSWSTNSFAMSVPDGADENAPGTYGNRVFATGYNAYGFGWADEFLRVHNNLVYMHGLDLRERWHETWGDINLLAAFRVTNYGKGGQKRNDLRYFNNLVILRAKEGANIQGSRIFSDESNEGIVFSDNVVKSERLDDVPAPYSGSIVTHGHYRKENSLPVHYRNNTLISNQVIVQFGEAYSRGNKHIFESNRFVRFGARPDFATFRFGGQYYSHGHVIRDGIFAGGAAADDVFWEQTGPQSNYQVQWTLSVNSAPNAEVRVIDAQETLVFEGRTDEQGRLSIPLTEGAYSPGKEARERTVTRQTPHVVMVAGTRHEVTMHGPQELNAR